MSLVVLSPPTQVDDVYTSGATVSEAVRVVKENGARKVIVLVAAKA